MEAVDDTVFDGNTLLSGTLPETKPSIALVSYSTDGSESNSPMVGRHSIKSRAAGDIVFSLEYRSELYWQVDKEVTKTSWADSIG